MVCSSPLHDTDLASQAVSPMEPGRVWECFFNVFCARLFFYSAVLKACKQAECVSVLDGSIIPWWRSSFRRVFGGNARGTFFAIPNIFRIFALSKTQKWTTDEKRSENKAAVSILLTFRHVVTACRMQQTCRTAVIDSRYATCYLRYRHRLVDRRSLRLGDALPL